MHNSTTSKNIDKIREESIQGRKPFENTYMLKFRFSKKATRFDETSHVDLTK